jgi:mRNA interferase MazF
MNAGDIESSGLKVSSLIRLGMLATIPSPAVLGQLGTISKERLIRLRNRLARHIGEERQLSQDD